MRMKSEAKTAIALFGGAAILFVAVGYGGGGSKLPTGTTATTTAPSSSVMPVSLSAASHGDPPSGCIHRANC